MKRKVNPQGEPFRIFMETWDKIKYSLGAGCYIGRNTQMEERELNIVEIRKADKDNLLQSLKNKEIKEQTTGVDSKTE